MVKYEDRVNKKPFTPRKVDDELFDNQEIIKQLHYSKIQKIKEKVSQKIKLLSELGVKKCVSCKKPIGLTTKGFIVMVICIDCFDNPRSVVGHILRKEWSAKENE